MNEIYVQIGENKYPIALDAIIQRQDPMDRSWTNWCHITVSNFTVSGDMTEYGKQVFHEYLANGKCQVTVYTGCHMPVRIASRRKPMRNTRIQQVQAKRKALDLSQDGKCCSLRTRRASLALRKAEQRWYRDMSAKQPLASEFEHIPARVARKQAKDARRFWRSWGPTTDPNYFDLSDYLVNESLDEWLVRKSAEAYGLCADEIEENYNG